MRRETWSTRLGFHKIRRQKEVKQPPERVPICSERERERCLMGKVSLCQNFGTKISFSPTLMEANQIQTWYFVPLTHRFPFRHNTYLVFRCYTLYVSLSLGVITHNYRHYFFGNLSYSHLM